MYVINADTCISCGACAGTCPTDAISEGEGTYVISDACVDCGSCVDSCPVDAISEG